MAVFVSAASSAGAAPSVPAFASESIADFEAALQHGRQRALDTVHRDPGRYRAYRFIDAQMVLVGVASGVAVDANGRLHVVQAHGQPMGGHPNVTHVEFSHILLPAGVIPPGR